MPANLPPQYIETERKLKSAESPEEKLNVLEELLAMIPKHKGTEKLQAQLKTKISKVKSSAQKKSSTNKHSYKIKKSGAGQVVIIGPPNSGKSMLVKALTDAHPEIGDYPFTTITAYPAMMKFKNIQIQLVDTPPITPDYMEIWFPDMVKAANGIIILIDPSAVEPDSYEALQGLLKRLRERKIEFLHHEANPFLVPNAERGWSYKKALMVANKSDLPGASENKDILNELLDHQWELFSISALNGDGLDLLRMQIYKLLDVIRVFSKIPGKSVEYESPFTLKKGSTVMDMAKAVHQDFAKNLKFARIWNKNKYDGQRVNQDCLLADEDIIELHM